VSPRLDYSPLVFNLRPSVAKRTAATDEARMGEILIESSGHVLTAPFKANFESFVSSEEQN
jgi:hypothetical protein